MYDTQRSREQILEMLSAAPLRLAQMTEGSPAALLLAAPGPGEWSARDVLAHLRSCSDMWGQAIERILSEERPTFKAVNPTTWIKQTNYGVLDFHPSLEAYAQQRGALLARLRPLAPEDWSRAAMVTGVGTPRERSVYTYALWLANHEKIHLKQMERAVQARTGGRPEDARSSRA